jgi:hypothetical protein
MEDLLKAILGAMSLRIVSGEGTNAVQFGVVPDSMNVVDVENFGDHPRRVRSHPQFSALESFEAYTARHKLASSSIYVAQDVAPGKPLATAIFDDHNTPGDGDRTFGSVEAAWGDHRATLFASVSPEYAMLTAFDGKLFDQSEFALAIRQIARFATTPAAADILEITRSISLASKGAFNSFTEDQSGSVNFAYDLKVSATAGTQTKKVEVPATFGFRMAILAGAAPIEIDAEFVYRVPSNPGGEVKLGLRLPNRVWDEAAAIDGVVEKLAGLGLPIYRSHGLAGNGAGQAANGRVAQR